MSFPTRASVRARSLGSAVGRRIRPRVLGRAIGALALVGITSGDAVSQQGWDAGPPPAGERRGQEPGAASLAPVEGGGVPADIGGGTAQYGDTTLELGSADLEIGPLDAEVSPAAPGSGDLGSLRADLASLLDDGVRSGRWGALVVSLTRGDTLLSVRADELLTPASTMKLFTAALALDRFGPDYQFSTDVLRDGPVSPDGVLDGNLVLRGDGDPGFSNRYLRGPPDAPLDLLARYVVGAGITRVRGDLIADATGFEERRIPEGWIWRYLGYGYAAPVSALSVNENVVWVAVEPGANGATARAFLEPSSSVMEVRSAVRTTAGRGGRIIVRRTGEHGIEARGWIGTRSPVRRYQLVIQDPALFSGGAFRDALARHGVQVEGEVRLAPTPAGAERVAGLPSPSVARLVSVMNRESINHFAELLYRNAARGPARDGIGSADRAYDLLHSFMVERVGAMPGSIRATDGSGLSTLDRVTPRALIQLLDYAHRAPWSSVFHASLPVAGESELLRTRMRSTPAQGNLHAKTGTTNGVISLAGYSTSLNGEVLAFAFIYNGADRWNARRTIDRMGTSLASFTRD